MISGAKCAFILILFVNLHAVVSVALLLLLVGALLYSVVSIIAALRYRAVKAPALRSAEPISILKPLAGMDLNLESNLRTFFEQDYPAFEILFAVRSLNVPEAEVVARLRREYPQVPSRIIITGEAPYPNAKVYSLEQMLSAATHDLVVMSDSDIRSNPDLLRTIASEFQDSHLGLATCPYRAIGGPSFWSQLEATSMNTDFWGKAFVARMIEGMRFAVGPTIVARRGVLQSIGGFNRVKDYLAEDFWMGRLAADAGHRVILSSYVIEHHIGNATVRENFKHRIRWARSTRRSRPAGYVGQVFTMPLPLALLACLLTPAWWPLLPLALVLRALSAYMVCEYALRARLTWLLLPLEDMIGFGFWIAGFFGKTIIWRARRYRLSWDGRFELISPSEQSN
jgi:ceramide glucosyltransferase